MHGVFNMNLTASDEIMGPTRDGLHEGIFGSPPEPLFNLDTHGMQPELLHDWLHVLAQENMTLLNGTSTKQGLFKTGVGSEFVFLCCMKLQLPPQSKYVALEIFDKFMVQHVEDLYQHVLTSVSKNQKQTWLTIQQKVQKQMMLRALSCCQLASKLTSHYKIITPRKVRNTMSLVGHNYSLESVVQSEIRVLKTVGFKVSVTTPLTYIETLLEILGHNDPERPVKAYHRTCLLMLDLYYMKRHDIYNSLYNISTENALTSPRLRSDFAPVEADMMLLGASTVCAAAYVMDQPSIEKVINQVSGITKIPCGDILDFASILIQEVPEDNEP